MECRTPSCRRCSAGVARFEAWRFSLSTEHTLSDARDGLPSCEVGFTEFEFGRFELKARHKMADLLAPADEYDAADVLQLHAFGFVQLAPDQTAFGGNVEFALQRIHGSL